MLGTFDPLNRGTGIVETRLRIKSWREQLPILGIDGVMAKKLDCREPLTLARIIEPGICICGRQWLVLSASGR